MSSPAPSAYNIHESPFITRTSSNDTRIVSSDKHTLYMDRFLLCHVSPVFRDMYEVSSRPTASPTMDEDGDSRAVQLAESGETLDFLFRHVDPNRCLPRLSIRQLFAVISAAQKYQMDGALARLRSSLTTPAIIRSASPSPSNYQGTRTSCRPVNLIVSNPLPAAVLAHTFRFNEELRMAFRELARCSIDIIVQNEQACLLPAELFQYILQLRRQRVTWLKAKAKLIYHYPISAGSITTSVSSGGFFGTGSSAPKDCPYCMRHRALHIHDACTKIDEEPSWDIFKAEIQRTYSSKCSCGAPTIPTSNDKFNADFIQWENDARHMESELPDWPPEYGSEDWHL